MGFFEDTPAVMVELFALVLISVIMFMVIGQVSGMFDVIETSGVVPNYTNNVGRSLVATFPILDQGILVVMIFMMLVTLILAWYIPSHPALAIGYVILVIVLVLIAPIFTNIYAMFAANSFISPYAVSFPIANMIMSNLPLIVVVFSAMVAIVSYGKPRSDQASILQGMG